MTPLVVAHVGLTLWSLRRSLLIALVTVLLGPPLLGLLALGLFVPVAASHGIVAPPVHQAVLTQPFGCTSDVREPWAEDCPDHHRHTGIDLAAEPGTPVLAAAAGQIVVGSEPQGLGLYLVVSHAAGFSTLYAHLEAALVQSGDRVAAGQPIGLVGSSGYSSGAHLHFEVRIAGGPVDPIPFLALAAWEVMPESRPASMMPI